MLYPIVPIYLKSIGFSVILIGILEGTAEACAGLSKGYFERLSDIHTKRLPFLRLGYRLSAASKPIMGLFPCPAWVLGAKTADRLGKGIRTGIRFLYFRDFRSSFTHIFHESSIERKYIISYL